MSFDLFADVAEVDAEPVFLAPGAKLLRALAVPATASLLSAITEVTARAP